MDWNLTFDILKSISIIIASCVAIYGINSWRREIKWKRKYELAEETLSLFYEVRDIITTIRNPLTYSNEGKSRERIPNEKSEDSKILDMAYVVVERYEKNNEAFHKLQALKYRFITIFGTKSEKPFQDIIALTNRILNASNRLGNRYWKDHGRRNFSEGQFKKHLAKMNEFEDLIWDNYGDDDIVRAQLVDIISNIEEICQSILKKK